jgi:hypothetical protein
VTRKWFGPSRKEIWQSLSQEIGGQYHPGTIWTGDKVQATHGEWTVTLDTYTVSTGKVTMSYTRMRAPYVNPEGFRFAVSRRHLLSSISRWMGMQDVEVGHEAFDHDFIIKGTHEGRLRTLFANAKIRDLLSQQPDVHFTVKDNEGWFGPEFPEHVDELDFTVSGIIKDMERLQTLYELFAETLDELTRMGSAYARDPDVEL